MSPLTVLLIPPEGSDLLADECGGRVPTMMPVRCQIHGYVLPLPKGGAYICPACCDARLSDDKWGDIRFEPSALLLVLDGTLVPMGWDRFRRCWRGGGAAPWANPSIHEVIAYARAFAADGGTRVVLLRDGREVTE